MDYLDYATRIPIRYSVDVFIAGGGPAGVAASVAAARAGASVLLVESQECLGGMGTSGLVPMFCQFGDGLHFLAGGIGQEVYDACFTNGITGPEDLELAPRKLHSISFQAEGLKQVYDDLVVGSGANLLLGTRLVDVVAAQGTVQHVICAAKSGLFAIKAGIYVDCTGDGDLAAWAGADYVKGNKNGQLQAGTLCSMWANINWDKHRASGTTAEWPRDQRPPINQAIADGVFSIPDTSLPGMWRTGHTLGGGNIGHLFGLDGTDEVSRTRAAIWGRKLLNEYKRYYHDYLTGFEDMELAATGALLGIRETRRIIGEYTLTLNDYMRRAVFFDEIGRYNYMVDVHPPKPDASTHGARVDHSAGLHCDRGESYGIPYRVLLPRGLNNTLVAGRCVSTDRAVNGSIRVMPGCFITGQAAGMAAAMSASRGITPSTLPVQELQQALINMGAYLPNRGAAC